MTTTNIMFRRAALLVEARRAHDYSYLCVFPARP